LQSRNHQEKDDRELLQHYYDEKNSAWIGVLLERYTMLLFGVCMKYLRNEEEAKESVQQIFFSVITDIHRFKVDNFKGWIYMVAKNHCLMKLRKKKNHLQEVNEQISAPDDAGDARSLLEKEKTYDNLDVALSKLNAEQKLCITLFYLEKKSYQQVVDLTGYTLMQVKSHIQNGKRNLRILLERMIRDEK
jgi:RNA polymerase sigma factor (sigma-70 family)